MHNFDLCNKLVDKTGLDLAYNLEGLLNIKVITVLLIILVKDISKNNFLRNLNFGKINYEIIISSIAYILKF